MLAILAATTGVLLALQILTRIRVRAHEEEIDLIRHSVASHLRHHRHKANACGCDGTNSEAWQAIEAFNEEALSGGRNGASN